ncbi:hypothetical protein PR048_005037 [Dryococelus australis]|uniref:DDE Tnp4 domain-containing protein n=1 Tax=Dryococelus australis TaxID=614101 RepID=A0ABQ9I732_9NEOP|nr:hypothetical protein PR048_005037 [Dryococelus australis]
MFDKKWGFPNCLGAADSKHIQILCPKGSVLFHYKSYFSIVILAVYDTFCRFILIEVGAYVKESDDGGIFRKSVLFEKITNGSLNIPEDTVLSSTDIKVPFVFIADEAYPLLRLLMKPYGRRNFNDRKE